MKERRKSRQRKSINSPNAADLECKVKLIENQLEAMKGIQSYAVDLMALCPQLYAY
ncbi:MAG: hypothetical protein ACLUKN_16440 [Bacilli bacterium]